MNSIQACAVESLNAFVRLCLDLDEELMPWQKAVQSSAHAKVDCLSGCLMHACALLYTGGQRHAADAGVDDRGKAAVRESTEPAAWHERPWRGGDPGQSGSGRTLSPGAPEPSTTAAVINSAGVHPHASSTPCLLLWTCPTDVLVEGALR